MIKSKEKYSYICVYNGIDFFPPFLYWVNFTLYIDNVSMSIPCFIWNAMEDRFVHTAHSRLQRRTLLPAKKLLSLTALSKLSGC